MQTCTSDWHKGDPLGATGQFPKRRIIVDITKPDGKPMEPLGPAPRHVYPLVLVILPGDDDYYKDNREGNVGAFIGLIRICDWFFIYIIGTDYISRGQFKTLLHFKMLHILIFMFNSH